MGSGSENQFRKDLPASVAKLGEDELLVFREDRREKKYTIKKKNSTRIGIIERKRKNNLFLQSIFLQYGFIA